MVRTFPQVNSGFWYFWDELAATVAAGDIDVTVEEMPIAVVEGGTDDGRTARDDGGFPTTVAVGVTDPNTFYVDFVGTLAGSPVEAGREATAEEEAYLKAVEAATANLEAMFEAAFSDPAFEAAFDGGDYDGAGVAAALELVLNGAAASHEAVAGLSPPSSLQAAHDNFLEIFGVIAERGDDMITAAAQAETIEDFFANAPQFPDLNDGCAPIAAEANFLGVDVVIACNPQQ
jgi:hypothetical protein